MSTRSFSVEYDFEEIRIFGEGLMAWGTATLVHDCDGEFYVSDMTLTDGTYLSRKGGPGLGCEFTKRLFNRIAIEIENDAHAQDFFKRKLDDTYVEPDGDYLYEQWRDRHIGHNASARLERVYNALGNMEAAE